MRKVFFTLILSTFIMHNAYANNRTDRYKSDCLSVIDEPKISLTSSYGQLVYNTEKDQDFLLKETQRRGGDNLSKKFAPAGLTKVRDGFNFKMEIGVIDIGGGHSCLYPEKINVHLGYYVPTIYILNTLDKESCMYSLVLRHEQTHMQIYIEALDYFLPILKQTVDNLFFQVGVDIIRNGDDSKLKAKEYNDKYLRVVQNKVVQWRKEVEEEQMHLDTLEQYVLENKICQKYDKK